MLHRRLCVRTYASVRPVRDFQRKGMISLLRRLTGWRTAFWPLALAILFLAFSPATRAQVTATLSGTVEDQSGGVIPGAEVTLTDTATGVQRLVKTDAAGLYAFPSLSPGTYDIKAAAKGFKAKQITGIVLNAGEARTIPAFGLEVGAASETVTVSATSQMIPIETGSKVDVLSSHDISNMALEGQDATELLKALPGAVTQSSGLTQTSPTFNDENITVDESAVGSGVNINGGVYRGGTAIEMDGAQMLDIGDMASSLTIIIAPFVAEETVQASNMGAQNPYGPVVVSAISRSGGSKYHGEVYFNARNNVLNANSWQNNDDIPKIPLGSGHYYYPGASFGGPVPGTHQHLLFWAGYQYWWQNQGTSGNVLTSFIPTPAMMGNGAENPGKPDFSTDDAANNSICPHGFFQGNPPNSPGAGSWCNDIASTIFANGTTTAATGSPAATGTYTTGTGSSAVTYNTDAGQVGPAGFMDAGAQALAKIWPKATSATPLSVCGGCNYYMPVDNIDDGWIYNFRLDYQLGQNMHIYGVYQQAYSSGLASGNGAHLYWTPGNSIPYPGGGEHEYNHGKTVVGHIVYNFNATTTNDLMAAWAFGSYPFETPDPAAAFKSTLGYPYATVFGNPLSVQIPAFNTAGNFTFPDFSQASIFTDPVGQYAVKKEVPEFGDTLTKVWGQHTIQMGGYEATADNYQSSDSYNSNGIMSFSAGQNPDVYNTGLKEIGSQYNAVAQLFSGIMSSYSENSASPPGDVAAMQLAGFLQDTWKATPRLTLDLGMRAEHVGHWYDRTGQGIAVFYPSKVLSDYYSGKYAPGYYWHSIDAGVPLSGQPNRFVYPDARLGLAYDVFGRGNTVVRGGWGVYRYVTQVNTIANGATPDTTPDQVETYATPGGFSLQMQDVSSKLYVACPGPNGTGTATAGSGYTNPPCPAGAGGNATQWGLDPSDYGQPMTISYNFTIDQRLPWNSQFEIAYVGNRSSQLVDAGEDIEGSTFSQLADQNKTPLGALFKPDPRTGVLSTNPENVTENPNLSTFTATPTGNTLADYHALGQVYGTQSAYMIQSLDYGNYNALQASWVKTAGRLTFDFNGSWSKSLYTDLQENPYVVRDNYGPSSYDRPLVFNATYTYSSGTLHAGSGFVNELGSGWTISGISTWQQGGYIPAFLGNGVPNYGLGLQYTNLPTPPTGTLATDTGITNSLSGKSYFGTDETDTNGTYPIMPVLTCNPTKGVSGHQILNGTCFTAPPLSFNAPGVAAGTAAPASSVQGGQNFPYMHMTPYFDNDLALYRTFHIHENQDIQFRASAFDWLNHSLLEFSGSSYYSLNYNVNYATRAISPNYPTSGSTEFGLMTDRSQLPYARIIELDLRYSF